MTSIPYRRCCTGCTTRARAEKDDEQEVLYTTALEPDQVPDKVQEGQPLVLPGGEFAMFSYEGPTEGLQDFILTVYGTCLPALQLTRRKGTTSSASIRKASAVRIRRLSRSSAIT